MYVMRASELVNKCVDVAKNYKTLYVMGCFGAPMTASNKARYTKNHDYNKNATRTAMINAASADTFGFDCVCLIKGLLWGWNGDTSKVYGGAYYASNGVPDIGADSMIKVCSEVSTDFSKIVPGAAVWLSGHIGVYIGDGLAVECSPAFENKVQITAVANIGKKSGYNSRKWTKWGKLPYIDYTPEAAPAPEPELEPEAPSHENGYGASPWAVTGAAYCVEKGIFAGVGNNDYAWGRPITREEVACVLYRVLEGLGALDKLPDKK